MRYLDTIINEEFQNRNNFKRSTIAVDAKLRPIWKDENIWLKSLPGNQENGWNQSLNKNCLMLSEHFWLSWAIITNNSSCYKNKSHQERQIMPEIKAQTVVCIGLLINSGIIVKNPIFRNEVLQHHPRHFLCISYHKWCRMRHHQTRKSLVERHRQEEKFEMVKICYVPTIFPHSHPTSFYIRQKKKQKEKKWADNLIDWTRRSFTENLTLENDQYSMIWSCVHLYNNHIRS